jgi:glycine/sarcosine N-methyltransferase
MMTLYESLAPLYEALFPINPRTVPFLDSLVPGGARERRVLDAGCATGSHALALAALGWSATGVDSEASMIALASARNPSPPGRCAFSVGDILDLNEGYEDASFDLVLCLGNTLPHLIGGGAAAFLSQARGLLAPGGALVLQTLNFALPRIGPGFVFPELSAQGAVMRRSYQSPPPEQAGTLRFVVELETGAGVQVSETPLLPLAPARIEELLAEAGFAPPSRISGWDGAAFDEGRDLYCVTVAGA